MYLEFSRIATLICSLLITIGLYHQVYKIWHTKCARDFAWTIVLSLILNELAWLNYGFALREWPIIVVGLTNIPGAILVGLGFLRFGNHPRNTLEVIHAQAADSNVSSATPEITQRKGH